MLRSRLAEATLIGCLAALASFCALHARAGETYSIVAQSTPSSAATGRLPLSARIAAANLPIITQSAAVPPKEAFPKAVAHASAPDTETHVEPSGPQENMAVAAVRVDHELEAIAEPPPRPSLTIPVLWPFGAMKWPTASTQRPSPATQAAPSAKAKAHKSQTATVTKAASAGTSTASAGRGGQRQADARSSGKGLSSSSPVSVTR